MASTEILISMRTFLKVSISIREFCISISIKYCIDGFWHIKHPYPAIILGSTFLELSASPSSLSFSPFFKPHVHDGAVRALLRLAHRSRKKTKYRCFSHSFCMKHVGHFCLLTLMMNILQSLVFVYWQIICHFSSKVTCWMVALVSIFLFYYNWKYSSNSWN